MWHALERTLERAFDRPGPRRFARLLGTRERDGSAFMAIAGATLPGFRVTEADRPRTLALEGRHRFAEYSLTFRLAGDGAGGTTVRVETRARFPGLHGQAYRGLVVGTRAHVLVVRRILRALADRAERAPRAL